METKEEQIVALPHFTSEEVEVLKVEHERRELLFKGRGLLDNDEERVRDAVQRGNYWTEQISHLIRLGHSPYTEDMQHALNQLSECLHLQGHIEGALQIVADAGRKAQYENTLAAIQRDDDESCDCDAETQIVGKYPSAKHGGQLVPVKRCVSCGDTNIG